MNQRELPPIIQKMVGLHYLAKSALILLAIVVGVLISFIFTPDFTYRSISDRFVWVGIGSIIIAGFGVISMSGLNQAANLPDVIVKKEHARRLYDGHLEMRARIEKRYDFCIMFFVAGLGSIAIGVIIQVVGVRLWPGM